MTLTPSSTTEDSRVVLLADGTTTLVRALRHDDHDAVSALHDRASDESIRRRFFAVGRASARYFVERVCVPHPDTFSLVASRQGLVVGLATAVDEGQDAAEVAMLVDDSVHGLGIGSVLLEELARDARRRGVRTFTAEVLVENSPMLRVFHDLGFQVHQHRDHEVLLMSMDLTVDAKTVETADARHRHSTRMSLLPLFEPTSVAVVGVAGDACGSAGRSWRTCGPAGTAAGGMAVGRRGLQLPGVTCVSEVRDLPPGLDLAIVAVPRDALMATLSTLAGLGTRAAVVVTAGLRERGPAGDALERRLAALAREHDMRVVGPNCFGVLSNVRGTRLDATFGRVRPRTGPPRRRLPVRWRRAGGARRRSRASLGIAGFVSLGNKADVSGNDLIAAWADDPDVRAGGLYLESFHDPRTFARLAAEMSRTKPLLVVFGGRSAAGTRAGASHTAALHSPRAHSRPCSGRPG